MKQAGEAAARFRTLIGLGSADTPEVSPPPERVGLPVWLVQFAGWAMLLLPLLFALSLLMRPLGMVLGICARMALVAGRLMHADKRPAATRSVSP